MPAAAAARSVGLLYGTFFALVGATGPYLALCLADRGFGVEAIGVLMALPQAVRIVAPPFWGWLADGRLGRAHVLRVSASGVLAGLLLLAVSGDRIVLVGAAILLTFFAMAAQTPVVEAIAMAIAGRDTGRYGRMRVWGSIGFIAAVTSLGPLVDRFGARSLPAWLIAIGAAVLAASWRAPRVPAASAAPGAGGPGRVRDRLREPAVAALFASAGCMVFAHASLYAFFSLYLQRQGYSGAQIGLVWALGVVAEIVLFWCQRPLFERFGAMPLLAVSLGVAIVRFAGIALSDGAVAWIVLAQLLHAVTFGVHHSACMSLLQRWFDPQQQSRAQALFSAIAYGVGGSSGALAAGWIWTHVSPAAMFGASAVAAAFGLVAVALGRRRVYARGS